MADLLSFNQPLIVLERRKKKDEDGKKIKSPCSLLLFPCVGAKEEDQEEGDASSSFPFADGG